MGIYYFTHGSNAGGGWTKVVVSGMNTDGELSEFDIACEAYSLQHPRKDGFIDCAFIYDVKEFNASKMRDAGNFGKRCVEEIRLVREEVAGT